MARDLQPMTIRPLDRSRMRKHLKELDNVLGGLHENDAYHPEIMKLTAAVTRARASLAIELPVEEKLQLKIENNYIPYNDHEKKCKHCSNFVGEGFYLSHLDVCEK